jgi:hypothetical protein
MTMNFEEMQVIWDSQNKRTMYALDTNGLHENVKRRCRNLGWKVTCEEFGLVAISLVVALEQASKPFLEGIDAYRYVGALLFVGVALYILLGRFRRLQREREFESTLVGDLDRAISRVDYNIWRARTFTWWFLFPAAVIVSIAFFQELGEAPIWPWFFVAGSFWLGQAVVKKGLNCIQLPDKRELEALRSTLSEQA